MYKVGETAKCSLEVTCPQCGARADSYLPFELCSSSFSTYLETYHRDWLFRPRPHRGDLVIWFFPDIISDFPANETGWPALRRATICPACGLRGLYSFRCVPTSERWGLDPELRINHCPICGLGPWDRSYTVDELDHTFDICGGDDGCWTEYGCDDTPEFREAWREKAIEKYGADYVAKRLANSIARWNVEIDDLWKHYTHGPDEPSLSMRMIL